MSNIVPFQDLQQIAKALSYGKMFGKTAEELLPLMLIAQAEGKHPAIAAQEFDVIQGRPAINSKAALARFQSAGGCIQWLSRTDVESSAKFSHAQGGELVITWTMERAKQAGLTGKDNWRKYPAQMLSARVVAEGVRAVFPACLSGMYTSEEVTDLVPAKGNTSSISERFAPPVIDITPSPAPETPAVQSEPAPAVVATQDLDELYEMVAKIAENRPGQECDDVVAEITKGKYLQVIDIEKMDAKTLNRFRQLLVKALES